MPEVRKDETVNISVGALKEILADQARQNADNLREIIQEIKKPTVLEQQEIDRQKAEILARNEERKANAQGIKAQMAQKAADRAACNHKHKNGQTKGAHVQEKTGLGYIICLRNQCKIRPGVAPDGYKGTDIYDTRLYNDLFQNLATNDLIQA